MPDITFKRALSVPVEICLKPETSSLVATRYVRVEGKLGIVWC